MTVVKMAVRGQDEEQITHIAKGTTVLHRLEAQKSNRRQRKGSIFVEYLLLLTIIGLGGLVGISDVRAALHNELIELAFAIDSITPPVTMPDPND